MIVPDHSIAILEAAFELSVRSDASRATFEAYLLAGRPGRRDDCQFFLLLPAISNWASRHKGHLNYLKDDLESDDYLRRYFAAACLGLISPTVEEVLSLEEDGELGPIWVMLDSASRMGAGGNFMTVEPLWPQEKIEEQAVWMSRQYKFPKGKKVKIGDLLRMIEKKAARPILWYPDPGVNKNDFCLIDDFVGTDIFGKKKRSASVVDMLRMCGYYATDKHPLNKQEDTLQYIIIPSRTCILMIGVPLNNPIKGKDEYLPRRWRDMEREHDGLDNGFTE